MTKAAQGGYELYNVPFLHALSVAPVLIQLFVAPAAFAAVSGLNLT